VGWAWVGVAECQSALRTAHSALSTSLVLALMPLSASSMVLMPFDMLSIRLLRSPARALRDAAVKKLVGLSRAELTRLPVERRSCVLPIRLAVFWSESRFERTALESEISDM